MESHICPFLGLIDDPKTCTTYPDLANACHNAGKPALINLDYQRTNCLQNTHRRCPGYLHGWKDGVPRSIQRRKPMISPSLRDGLMWLLLALPVIIFLWAGFSGQLSFIGIDFRPGRASAPTSLPFFTRTPTETLTPTSTLTQNLTFTPTIEPDTPTPTQTETATPTQTETYTQTPTSTATRFFWTVPPSTPTNTPTQPPPPTNTPLPTNTPRPTNTPIPTATPTIQTPTPELPD